VILVFCSSWSASIHAAVKTKNPPKEEKKYPEVEPKKLYDRVWKLIKSDYVDQTYNNQDWEI
jgi:hypothetical protein